MSRHSCSGAKSTSSSRAELPPLLLMGAGGGLLCCEHPAMGRAVLGLSQGWKAVLGLLFFFFFLAKCNHVEGEAEVLMGERATRHWGLRAQCGESWGRRSSSVALLLFLGDARPHSLPSAALSIRGVGPGSSPSQPGSCCSWWLSDHPAVHEAVTVLGLGQLQHSISIETPCLLAAPQPPAACCWPGRNTGEVSAL